MEFQGKMRMSPQQLQALHFPLPQPHFPLVLLLIPSFLSFLTFFCMDEYRENLCYAVTGGAVRYSISVLLNLAVSWSMGSQKDAFLFLNVFFGWDLCVVFTVFRFPPHTAKGTSWVVRVNFYPKPTVHRPSWIRGTVDGRNPAPPGIIKLCK